MHKITYTQFITNIRDEVLKRTGVPVSIGLCSSKTLAKLASDKAKKFGKKQQFSLFDNLEPEDDKLSRVIDQLENKFGSGIIKTLR